MMQSRAFAPAFQRDLIAARRDSFARWATLYHSNRKAFVRDLAAAKGAADPRAEISGCLVLHRNGDLGPKGALRFWRLLLQEDRPVEALDILQTYGRDHQGVAAYWRDLALAFAMSGLTQQGCDAADHAVELDPAHQPLQVELAELRSLQARPATQPAWEDVLRQAELELRFRLPEHAARTLQAAAPKLILTDAELAAFCAIAEELLSLMAPERVPDFVTAVRGLFPKATDQWEIVKLLACAQGGGDWAEIVGEDGAPRSGRSTRSFLAMAYVGAGLREAAMERLGRLAEHPDDAPSRFVLSRCVSREVLDQLDFRCGAGPGRRIFDVFPFHNELDMLDIRLQEMGGWVDQFVIVESVTTFTGRPKRLFFKENQARYAAFADKILHVVVEALPPQAASAWPREFYQRDMALKALNGVCAPDDLILVTDVDEIVSRAAVEGFDGEFATLKMEQSRFFLNYRRVLPRERQLGLTSIWKASYLPTVGLSYARTVLPSMPGRPKLFDAGWHFSSALSAEGAGEKMKDVSHQQYASLDRAHFEQLFAQIRNGQPEPGWARVEIDESFPAYVREHQAEFKRLLL